MTNVLAMTPARSFDYALPTCPFRRSVNTHPHPDPRANLSPWCLTYNARRAASDDKCRKGVGGVARTP